MRNTYHFSRTILVVVFRIIFILAIYLGISFLFIRNVQASPSAQSKYKVSVEVINSREVWVEYDIHLVNMSDDFFIRDYSVISDHTDLIDLTVREKGQKVDFRKEHENDKVRIRVSLIQRLVSKGDYTDLSIRYNTRQIFKKEGMLDVMYIPNIKTEENLEEASFTLIMPDSFREASYISLRDNEFEIVNGKKRFTYTQSQTPFGFFVIFGNTQQFEFIYTFKMQNTDMKDRSYSITLPPDTETQKVYFTNAYPEPYRVFSNEDGNNIVEYRLEPGSTENVRITGYTMYGLEQSGANITSIEKLLESTELWPTDMLYVEEVVRKNTHNKYNVSENAFFLYDYLVSNFSFKDSNFSEKVKISEVNLADKKLTCENFTDLYVTFLRSSGIPARKIVGYSKLEKKLDSVHFWIEIYDEDEERWISADPCMEAKLGYKGFNNIDPQRFILATYGVNDDKPDIIAPFSKYQDIENDNIEIKCTSYEYENKEENVNLAYDVGYPDLFFKNIPLKLHITNNSRSVFRLDDIRVNSAEVEYMSKHVLDDFNQAIFPGHADTIYLNLTNIKDVFAEKIENYEFELNANYGVNKFYKKENFSVNRPFSYMHLVSWFISALFSVMLISLFLLLIRKLKIKPKLKLKKRKIKYKYDFKKSKSKDFLDVPVSLR